MERNEVKYGMREREGKAGYTHRESCQVEEVKNKRRKEETKFYL